MAERLDTPFVSASDSESAHQPWTRGEIACVAIVVAVGAILRLHRIGELPLGLHQDEAIYGLNALNVAAGHFAIYFGEREPLYMYLVAAMSFIVGQGPIALRLTSAIVGSLAVLTTVLAARSLFGPRIGLFAGATMATALWPVMISRIGFRAGTLPLVEAAAIWVLWEGWKHRGRWRSAAGGALVALTLYTYLAGRFLPVVLTLFVLIGLLVCRRWVLSRAKCIAISLVAAIVAFSPLGYYFLRHPEAFFGRPAQVAAVSGTESAVAGPLSEILPNAARVVGMFFVEGDANWRHNLPPETVVLLPVALLMVVGLASAAVAARRPGMLLLLIWLPVMLLPSALSIDAPHYLRTLGAAPAVACAVGIGADWLVKRLPVRRPDVVAGLALTILLLPAISTWHTYFDVWANRPESQSAFNVDYAGVGRYLSGSDLWRAAERRVYLSRDFYPDRSSITYFLWPGLSPAEKRDWSLADRRVRWFDQSSTLPLPESGPAEIVLGPQAATIAKAIGDARTVEHYVAADDRVGFYTMNLPPSWRASAVSAPVGLVAEGSEGLSLQGWSADAAPDGETILTLYWRVRGRAQTDSPSAFVHLLDETGQTISSDDHIIGIDPSDWPVNGLLLTFHRLRLPAGAPGGQYPAEIGLYDRKTKTRQTMRVATRTDSRVSIDAIAFTARLWTAQDITPTSSIGRSFDGRVRLIGMDSVAAKASPGQKLIVTTYWEALSGIGDSEIEYGMVDPGGTETSVTRRRLGGNRYPSSQWKPGEAVRVPLDLAIDAEAKPGPYQLFVRVASPVASDGRAILGSVTVEGLPRTLVRPAVGHPIDVTFGDFARLVGYDLNGGTARPGGKIVLRLYWECIGATSGDYKVFTHLIDSRERVRGQQDSVPARGARPTSGWLPGEFIADDYELVVSDDADGTLQVEIGMYGASSGERLTTAATVGPAQDRFVLEPTLSVKR